MRKKVIEKLMSFISNRKDLAKEEYEKIEYGLISIYILVTKLVFIFIIAYILGIFKEMIIFLLLFNVIRSVAFGLHATKSYICLFTSTILFIGLPFLATKLYIQTFFKVIIGIIVTISIFKNSPADTKKRPIVNKIRRRNLKILSTLTSVTYVIFSVYTNNFISNCLILSIILEAILISPITYKLFNLPYNNYLSYIEKENNSVFS